MSEHHTALRRVSQRSTPVVRLSHRGQTIRQIAASTGRHPTSIGRDFDRWQEQGVAGLADGTAPGHPSRVTAEVKTYLGERLGEDRTWTAGQLAAAVADRFGITVSAEAIRQHLHALGYAWKRTRYVPGNCRTPARSRPPARSWAGEKGGASGRTHAEIPGRERSELGAAAVPDVDPAGAGASAPGADPLGLAGADQPDRHVVSGW